ncbi:MOSC domain-containing protein [Paraburkholderia sp. CNPSo 3076]|uniref:MOSC domain-containing protein n=1 Tax=Paraburkholderia sp. CNPSo 3076 TaxID=2940936 RepID=UPI002251FB53|nr:MOSC domain-containing protein [Paraburkholderia sp. CNPSo 3076]MCX5540701.1 MOSC domain-containing protein [Paraburkholderia sp. CNPSo 3076]
MTTTTNVEWLFAGGMGYLDHEGQRSGIFKRRMAGPVRVEALGIVGDEHGDPRVHGGPEKAVHHYAAENYARIAQAFAACAQALVPGSLGENISAWGLSERDVRIGDIYQVGSAMLQVSQPRSPCWKINHRFGVERMSMQIAEGRITGWYYRVLSPGVIAPGDAITLIERQTERFSIDEFWKVQLSHRPSIDTLVELIAIPGLAPDWKRRLGEREKWLRARR